MEEVYKFLGGSCTVCLSTSNLEIDHIKPEFKKYEISAIWSSRDRLYEELKKCQLLCKDCHLEKTIRERSLGHGKGLTGKRNCRCSLCAPLKNEYAKYYNSIRDRRKSA